LANDDVAQTLWKQARRLQAARGPHGEMEAEAPPSPVADPTTTEAA
jgi:hypothetical protein